MVENAEAFKERCRQYLKKENIATLRLYGRSLNLPNSTCLKKGELIEEILKVETGELEPERTRRGQPPKDNTFPEEIADEIRLMKEKEKAPTVEKAVCEEESQEGVEKINENVSSSGAVVFIRADLSKLTLRQRRLFNEFLRSL